jgi:hypothetical protein
MFRSSSSRKRATDFHITNLARFDCIRRVKRIGNIIIYYKMVSSSHNNEKPKMQFIKFILLSTLLLAGSVFGQSNLPACKGSDTTKWSNCIGTKTFENGTKYVGQWKAGKSNGQGTETYANGTKYVGQWKDDNYNGQGTLTQSNSDKYEGQWRNGKPHGQGTDTHADGRKYVGEFKYGKRNGQGTFTFSDGRKYVGEFKDENFHGQGIFTAADGKRQEGFWEDNKFIREAKVNSPNSNPSKNKGVNNNESSKSVETSQFVKEYPYYAEIDCRGFQIHACIDNFAFSNGEYFKIYKINDLLLLGGTNDGNVRIDRELELIDLHLKSKFSIKIQNATDYPILTVKVFNRGLDGNPGKVVFEKSTTKKYEVISVSR